MERTRLIFQGVSELAGTDEMGLITLTDEEERRQLAVACDKAMMREFALRLNHVPIVGRLLPEVLWHVVAIQAKMEFEVLITDVIENQYRALLLNTKTREPVAIRLGDAVLLAYIARLPIYVDSQLMEKQSTPYEKEARNVVIPMNTLSNKMLLDAFDKAVEEEKYELASRLRDEIRRRKLNDPS